MMRDKNCKICAKRFLCSKYGQVCDNYEKEPYSTIVIKENGVKEIRRID